MYVIILCMIKTVGVLSFFRIEEATQKKKKRGREVSGFDSHDEAGIHMHHGFLSEGCAYVSAMGTMARP